MKKWKRKTGSVGKRIFRYNTRPPSIPAPLFLLAFISSWGTHASRGFAATTNLRKTVLQERSPNHRQEPPLYKLSTRNHEGRYLTHLARAIIAEPSPKIVFLANPVSGDARWTNVPRWGRLKFLPIHRADFDAKNTRAAQGSAILRFFFLFVLR